MTLIFLVTGMNTAQGSLENSWLAQTGLPLESCMLSTARCWPAHMPLSWTNQPGGSAALTAQRWKLCVQECSNGPALGDRHLEIAHWFAQSQSMEQMPCSFFKMQLSWMSIPITAFPFRSSPDAASSWQNLRHCKGTDWSLQAKLH